MTQHELNEITLAIRRAAEAICARLDALLAALVKGESDE